MTNFSLSSRTLHCTGRSRSFEETPHQVSGIDFPFEEPERIGERERERKCVQNYNFDLTLAPEGKTGMRVYFATDYAYRKRLRQDFERYTGNWLETFLGWRITIKTLRLRMGKTLPSLENFYVAGKWLEPGGGVPTAALSGKEVIQIICSTDKKPFAGMVS